MDIILVLGKFLTSMLGILGLNLLYFGSSLASSFLSVRWSRCTRKYSLISHPACVLGMSGAVCTTWAFFSSL
ncbi:hypothetical protein F4703DRAFT_1830300 [Phycomyces blakesleeanus]